MKISLRKSHRTAASAVADSMGARRGIALIEIIVAMVLLAIVVSSLASLQYSVNQQAMRATGDAYKNGVLMQEMNRLEGIPYDSIAVGTFSTAVSGGAYPHTKTLTIAEPVVGQVKNIRVVVTPTNPRYKPDTASFTRTRARTSRVLCTTCGG
jgi:Tfp pilus assembly protein PilV